jgi:imidazole glycerol-phosphate synthase subunit HisH
MVVIIDYGMGNLRSILHKLQKMQIEGLISPRPEDIEKATHLILPGVGHFAAGMENLRRSGLIEILNRRVLQDKTPIMGICLGMQLLTEHSEEGDAAGLGWIKGRTVRFDSGTDANRLRVPHVGWNLISKKGPCPFLVDVADDQRFYFVHSYYVSCDHEQDIAATTRYGREFVSVVHRGNIFGTQFHPEKSHRRGIEIIRRFVQGGPA